MLTAVKCINCKSEYHFDLTPKQCLELMQSEKHVQDILPNLKPEEREMFISGFCPDCWNKIFGEEDG